MTDAYGCSCKNTFHDADCFAASNRGGGAPTPPPHIPVALTTDQLEDAKLGRALREFVEYDGSISRHVDIEGGIGPIQVELFDSNEGSYRAIGPTLLAALTAARRELETTSGTSQTPEPESEDRS